MGKISTSQKKTIMVSSIVLAAFSVFYLLIYLPAKNTVASIKSELLGIESQIQEIEEVIGRDKTMNEGIMLLKHRYQLLNAKLPQKEEETLRMFSDFARRLNAEVISIKPQPKRVFLDEDGKEVVIEGRVCHSISVSIEMRCLYESLVKYIEALEESLPAFISIEGLEISKKDKSQESKLRVLLGLSLCLLS